MADLKDLKHSLASLDSHARGLVVFIAVVLVIVGSVSINVGGWAGVALMSAVAASALVLFFLFHAPTSSQVHPFTSLLHPDWMGKYHSVQSLKEFFDALRQWENSAMKISLNEERWHLIPPRSWDLGAEACSLAIIHLFETLEKDEKLWLVTRMLEKRDCFPFKKVSGEICQYVENEINLLANPGDDPTLETNLRAALLRLKAFLQPYVPPADQDTIQPI